MQGQTGHLENLTHTQARQLKGEMRKLKVERDAAIELFCEAVGGTLTGANQLVRDRAQELMEEQMKNEDHRRNRKGRRNGQR